MTLMTVTSPTEHNRAYEYQSKLEHEQQDLAVVESNASLGWTELWSEEHQVQSRLTVGDNTICTVVLVIWTQEKSLRPILVLPSYSALLEPGRVKRPWSGYAQQ